MHRLWSGLIVAAALAAAACGGNQEPVGVETPVAVPTQVDSFSGTVAPAGTFQYQFRNTTTSQILVTLKAMSSVAIDPDPNADPPVTGKPSAPVTYPINVRIGQSTLTTLGLTCTNLKEVTTAAGDTPQLTGQALQGTFCIAVSDPNNSLPESVNITVTIAHS